MNFYRKKTENVPFIIIPSFYIPFETARTVSRHGAGSFFIFIADSVPRYFIVSLLLMTDAE